jgi:hypothetical protein
MEIPLRKAPEVFFDQQLWEIFQSYFETTQIALERISGLPEVPGYYYHRETDPTLPVSYKERWQTVQEATDIGKALLYGLRDQLLRKQIIATGTEFEYNSTERVIIPPERWLHLWPDFANNMAMAQLKLDDPLCGRYDDIRLTSNESASRARAVILEDCTSFLRQRRADGEETKGVLEREAAVRFGMPVPVRVFNEAFKAAFQKGRGRPRKQK